MHDLATSPEIPAPAPPPVTSKRTTGGAAPFEREIVLRAIWESFVKLDPRNLVKKPVIFVVYVGTIWATILFFRDIGSSSASENVFAALILVWLWFTVLFANFADAIAEGRGKAQAGTLRRMRKTTLAHVLQADGTLVEKPSTALRVGDRCVVAAGELIPGDGYVVDGMALVDESVITGESAPVIREAGGDRSGVTGGTMVLSDRTPDRRPIRVRDGDRPLGPVRRRTGRDRLAPARRPPAPRRGGRLDAEALMSPTAGTRRVVEPVGERGRHTCRGSAFPPIPGEGGDRQSVRSMTMAHAAHARRVRAPDGHRSRSLPSTTVAASDRGSGSGRHSSSPASSSRRSSTPCATTSSCRRRPDRY